MLTYSFVISWLLFILSFSTNTEIFAQTTCPEKDSKCAFYASQEYDAIRWLHAYLDDDKDGEIDPMESAEFLVSELEKSSREVTSKQTSFHQNDTHISVDELWNIWLNSKTHNWTTEEVVRWLESVVELPEYSHIFREQEIRGSTLPLIAANWNYFVPTILHIRNPIHKRKLIIKAQDVILFGPPMISAWMATVLLEVLAASLVVGIAFFVFYRRHSRGEIEKLKNELDHLKQAETTLGEMQHRLDALQQDAAQPRSSRNAYSEGESPVFKLGSPTELRRLTSTDVDEARREAERLSEERRATEEKLRRLELAEEELERLRELLSKMEHDLELSNAIKHPEILEQLLIMTFKIESRWLESRLGDAQRRMTLAREACEKVGRKQSHIFGILRVSHSTLTDVDRHVLEARLALDGVRTDVEERFERWNHIEELTGFRILNQQALLAMDDMHLKLTSASTSALNIRPLQRTGSSILKTRPHSETPLTDLSLEGDNLSLSGALKTAMTPSASFASSSNRTARTVLRHDSWINSEQGSHDSGSESAKTSNNNNNATPSSSSPSYEPPPPHLIASSTTPRRRQAP